jgi:hypothetical protein
MMNMTEKKIDDLFSRLHGQWDVHEPEEGHQVRFLDKLQPQNQVKKKAKIWPALSIAAMLIVLLGVFSIYEPGIQTGTSNEALAEISPKAREAQDYFASVIQSELAKVEKEKSPEARRIVKDALFRMEKLEKDYNELARQLIKDGENKQLLSAMITNLQTRISFLQDVMTQIENTKKLKQNQNETNQL